MLSTVLEVGVIVALIGGTAYFFFQYMPQIIEFFNSVQNVYFDQLTAYIPQWLQPFIMVGALFSGIGLLVKLL